jgi:tetratricopeptide (TPR) repeat protein
MKKALFLLILLFCFSIQGEAQKWSELNNKVITNYNQGNYSEATVYAEKALKQAKKEFGIKHQNYGTSLNNLALVYEGMGAYDKALPLYLASLENTEKNLGKDHSSYGINLNNLGQLYQTMGQYDKALPFLLEALDNIEKNLGKDHPSYGTSLNNLAILYQNTGQYQTALFLYLEVLENVEKSLGTNHSAYGRSLNNLASLYEIMGQYEKALPLFLSALDNVEKTLGKDHAYYGLNLDNLARIYSTLGQYEKAQLLYLEALENTEKSLGKNHSWYGSRLSGLASLYESMGHYDKALPLYLEALGNIEKSLGKEHPSYGTSLNNLAILFKTLGQFEKALPLFLEALENTEKSLGKAHYWHGISLNSLASLYKTTRQYDKALQLYWEALENIKESLGKDHAYYGSALNNLALLHKLLGQYEKALPLLLEALENGEKSLGKNHSEYGTRLVNLASLYEDIEQYEKALPLYLEALNNTEKNLGKAHIVYAKNLNYLAGLYERLGAYKNALPLFLEAIENISTQINRAFSFMSENEKEQFHKTISYLFEIYQSFFTRYSSTRPSIAAHAYNIELDTKGMILHSVRRTRQAIMSRGDQTAIAKFEEWSALRSILAQQYSLPLVQRRNDLREVEEKAEKLEADLSRLSIAFRDEGVLKSSSWEDVQKALEPGEVAIEFAAFGYHSASAWTDSTLYIALVLRKEDPHPYLVPLFEQKQLDSLLNSHNTTDAGFVTTLYRGASRVNIGGQSGNGKQLYALIWQPLEKYLSPGNTIFFAPSGSLHQLAFAALPVNDNQLLSDHYQLQQLSTTSVLVREKQTSITLPESIALFGGINYDVSHEQLLTQANNIDVDQGVSLSLPQDIDRSGSAWSYLPGTLQEVASIASLAQEKHVSIQLFTKERALEEQVKALAGAQSPQVLHIATHGFFLPNPKQETKANWHIMGENNSICRASNNPLQRSGLLFAGANRAWQGEGVTVGLDDGILTAYEASHLYLGNTQLVVLSACETGLGDIVGSEGVFGLQRAFKQAGAEYLLMSLWKVPDNETAQFMDYFYKEWFAGKSIPEAFKSAQDYMKKKHSDDPYLWAGFVLVR